MRAAIPAGALALPGMPLALRRAGGVPPRDRTHCVNRRRRRSARLFAIRLKGLAENPHKVFTFP